MTDTFYVGIDDIRRVPPGELLPYGYMELLPGSGVGVPNPATNSLHPGWWPPNQMPAHPIDLAQMKSLAPGALGPYGYTELVPGTGVWIPDPHSALHTPTGPAPSPKKPLDMGRVKAFGPGALPPYGYGELIPGSGLYLPVEDLPSTPGATVPAGHHTPTDGHTPGKDFTFSYATLADKARSHDASAEDIARWVRADPDFAEKFLATHGKIAYPTYLRIKEYAETRQSTGSQYAQRHAETAASLREASRTFARVEDENATRFQTTLT